MDWRDEGILLAMRPHGETSAIIEVLTAAGGGGGGGYYGGGGGAHCSGGGGSSRVDFPGNSNTSTSVGVHVGDGQLTLEWTP